MAVVKELLAKGVDPNVRTPRSTVAAGGRGGGGGLQGRRAASRRRFMMAARGDHEDVMRALVAAGADPSLRAQDGANVVMAAAAGARLKTLKYAYELDPDVTAVTTPAGNTVMHVVVALNGRTQPEVVELMQFLVDRGAKLDEMNAAGPHSDCAGRRPAGRPRGGPADKTAHRARREAENSLQALSRDVSSRRSRDRQSLRWWCSLGLARRVPSRRRRAGAREDRG